MMPRFLKEKPLPFRTSKDRAALIGKTIKYLRPCDIGPGYAFPQIAHVVEAKHRQLLLENGNSLSVSSIVELVEEKPQ